MHKFNLDILSATDYMAETTKGLHADNREFVEQNEAVLQEAYANYLAHTVPCSLEQLEPIWPQTGGRTPLAAQWGHCAIPTCVCRNCWPSKFLRKEIIFCQHLDRPHTPTNFLSFLLSVDINRHNISFSHENTFGKTLH